MAAPADILAVEKVARVQIATLLASLIAALYCSMHLDLRVSLRVFCLVGDGQTSFKCFEMRSCQISRIPEHQLECRIYNSQLSVKD